jgi:hypothetical protein
LEGSFYCYCIDNFQTDASGVCQVMDPVQVQSLDAFKASNSEGLVAAFPQKVLDQIVHDSPMVLGTISFSSNAKSYDDFVIEEGSLSDSLTVEGTYVPLEGMATIPDELLVRVYFQDGLRGSSSVAPSTGFFSVSIVNAPYGL